MFQGVPGASDTSVNLPRKGKREKKTPGETMGPFSQEQAAGLCKGEMLRLLSARQRD